MTLELTKTETERLVEILKERYARSVRLFELAAIKSILQKLGEKVEDWTPTLEDVQS